VLVLVRVRAGGTEWCRGAGRSTSHAAAWLQFSDGDRPWAWRHVQVHHWRCRQRQHLTHRSL